MGLWGKLIKTVELSWGDGDATFKALLKKWREIFARSEMFGQFQSVEKPKENPSTIDEACTTLIAPDFTVKYWQDAYYAPGGEYTASDVNRSHCSHRDFNTIKQYENWDSAYYEIHIAYIAGGKTLVFDYITGDYDVDWEMASLRLSLVADDGSVNTASSVEAETENSDGVHFLDMCKELERESLELAVRKFFENLYNTAWHLEHDAENAAKAKAEEEEHKQVLDALGDL